MIRRILIVLRAIMDNPALPRVRLDDLENLARRADTVIGRLRDRIYAPGTEKQLDLRFPSVAPPRWWAAVKKPFATPRTMAACRCRTKTRNR